MDSSRTGFHFPAYSTHRSRPVSIRSGELTWLHMRPQWRHDGRFQPHNWKMLGGVAMWPKGTGHAKNSQREVLLSWLWRWGRGHEPRDVTASRSPKRQRNLLSPRASRKEDSPAYLELTCMKLVSCRTTWCTWNVNNRGKWVQNIREFSALFL